MRAHVEYSSRNYEGLWEILLTLVWSFFPTGTRPTVYITVSESLPAACVLPISLPNNSSLLIPTHSAATLLPASACMDLLAGTVGLSPVSFHRRCPVKASSACLPGSARWCKARPSQAFRWDASSRYQRPRVHERACVVVLGAAAPPGEGGEGPPSPDGAVVDGISVMNNERRTLQLSFTCKQ